MSGHRREGRGMTLREACVLAIAILGGQPSAADVWRFLAADGWQSSRGSVQATLSALRGAAVERAAPGEGWPGCPARWRLTEASRAWIAQGDRS
jgi:hypothetical protein